MYGAAGKLEAALRDIATSGALHQMSRSEAIAVITTAQRRGLVSWSKSRKCYRLTRAGYRIAANSNPQRNLHSRRRWLAAAMIPTVLAILAVGAVAVGSTFIATNDVRPLKVSDVQSLAVVQAPAPPLYEEPIAEVNEAVAPQQALPPVAGNPEEFAKSSARHEKSQITPAPRAQKERKIAAAHHRKTHRARRSPRHEMSPAYAFTGYSRFPRRERYTGSYFGLGLVPPGRWR
jgi:hypothetical protein